MHEQDWQAQKLFLVRRFVNQPRTIALSPVVWFTDKQYVNSQSKIFIMVFSIGIVLFVNQ